MLLHSKGAHGFRIRSNRALPVTKHAVVLRCSEDPSPGGKLEIGLHSSLAMDLRSMTLRKQTLWSLYRLSSTMSRPFALELARRAGAKESIRLADPAFTVDQVEALTNGRFCDVVIEATGKQEALDFASQITGIRGRLVIAGYHQDESTQVNLRLWNWRGLDVINSHERDSAISVRGLREAIDAMQSGALDPRPLLTHRMSLDRLDEALVLTRDRPEGFMKAVIIL